MLEQFHKSVYCPGLWGPSSSTNGAADGTKALQDCRCRISHAKGNAQIQNLVTSISLCPNVLVPENRFFPLVTRAAVAARTSTLSSTADKDFLIQQACRLQHLRQYTYRSITCYLQSMRPALLVQGDCLTPDNTVCSGSWQLKCYPTQMLIHSQLSLQ